VCVCRTNVLPSVLHDKLYMTWKYIIIFTHTHTNTRRIDTVYDVTLYYEHIVYYSCGVCVCKRSVCGYKSRGETLHRFTRVFRQRAVSHTTRRRRRVPSLCTILYYHYHNILLRFYSYLIFYYYYYYYYVCMCVFYSEPHSR